MSPANVVPSVTQCRLNAGWPPVVSDSAAGLAGRSPAGHVPPRPRAAGVPGSSDTRCTERLSRIKNAVARAISMRGEENARQSHQGKAFDALLRPVDFGKIHSEFRDSILDRYPLSVQNDLKAEYINKAGSKRQVLFGNARWAAVDAGLPTDSWQATDRWLAQEDLRLRVSRVDVGFDEDCLESIAKVSSRYCAGIRASNPPGISLQLASEHAIERGIAPPIPLKRGVSIAGCLNRLCAEGWWRRSLRRTYARQAEEALRARGLVSASGALYISHAGFAFRAAQRARNVAAMEKAVATNEEGHGVSLLELACTNTSAPELRRAELMARIAGIEAGSKAGGQAGIFFVITLPSRFHPAPVGKRLNPRFDGSTPRDGQAWLNRNWQRVRAALARQSISITGIRTVEPHHDGTPHWNLLVFARPADLEEIRRTIRHHFLLSESPEEPGAATRRVKMIDMDPARSATGYVAKYISKNIDGHRTGMDLEDHEQKRDALETCTRVEAWASLHGIRQFQFFGTPPVSVWRELRTLKEIQTGVLEDARRAADQSMWDALTSALRPQNTDSAAVWTVRILKAWSDKPGKYGDPRGEIVLGVESDDAQAITRLHEWQVVWNALPEQRLLH
jgi:hypothetical protein